MNPLSTGSEINPARKPSRSSPAMMATAPVTCQRRGEGHVVAAARVGNGAMVPAERAAVADIGPTTRCFDEPNMA